MQGSTSTPSSSEDKLRSQISQQTNEILQLQDDKEELENKIEELKELNEQLLEGDMPSQPLHQSMDKTMHSLEPE